MRVTLCFGLICFLFACGNSSDKDGSINEQNQTITEDSETEKQQLHENVYYLDSSMKSSYPVGQFPSLIEKDKTVLACKPGQSFFIDECWDEIHISLDYSGWVSFKRNEEIIPALSAGRINKTWVNSRKIISGIPNEDAEYDSILYSQDNLCFMLPFSQCVLEPFSRLEIKNGNATLDDSIKLHLNFGWNPDDKDKIDIPLFTDHVPKGVHSWYLNGMVVINGKSYKLPLNVKTIDENYDVIEYSLNSRKVTTDSGKKFEVFFGSKSGLVYEVRFQ